MIQLIHGDCLDKMRGIPAGSVDMVLTDPPYGTTACKWDTVIDLPSMWDQIGDVLKPNGACVLTSAQPFTSALVMSNPKAFKYSWVWEKSRPTGHLNANRMPLKSVEDVCVFYYKQCVFNKQMSEGRPNNVKDGAVRASEPTINHYGKFKNVEQHRTTKKNPKQVLRFGSADPRKALHPTQKPVALMEYLIKTYTNPGDTVLDFTMGSGSTGVACVNTGRKFIGIELDPGYFEIAERRIAEARQRKSA